jgi:hypothetical protein
MIKMAKKTMAKLVADVTLISNRGIETVLSFVDGLKLEDIPDPYKCFSMRITSKRVGRTGRYETSILPNDCAPTLYHRRPPKTGMADINSREEIIDAHFEAVDKYKRAYARQKETKDLNL